MKSEFAGEAQAAAAKLSVPAAVAGSQAIGLSLQEWVYALTAVFIVIQAAYLLWKWHREWKAKR